ncbi:MULTISPECIES: regulator of amino acid metabolism, contains ACT domain protein [Thermococcus]|uniref:Putative regulator of amino acid metabolism, contains ACT domain n=1 Tax=Thermococcus nautili TaxID=195522 RepID=W8P423_9EURY|nr:MULTISPECIES: regulator of amino acid metabolism, contains ACT domain protein [Thermococcus]AHL23556.1 putative regulator of amino acid metabolism, contains ACT domain [Thermococcus nautili]NJE49760.1 regulator of amino acid metabolism, contains ACT domain protein [Thermococcus sp. 9N3]CAI1492808.1 Putative regulator of amino acid metabolism, contains ACT domain [Thermococcus nautili]
MMLILEAYFKNYPARRKVAEFLFENGLSVRNGKIYLKNVEVPISELARAIGVNRKIIYHTIEYIEKTYPLKLIFERLNPLPSLIDVAPLMGWEVLEIDVEKGDYQGAFAEVMRILAESNVPVMEVFGRNLREETSKIFIVIDGTLPVETFARIKDIHGFQRLILHTPEKEKEKLVCNYCEVKYCPKRVLLEAINQRP